MKTWSGAAAKDRTRLRTWLVQLMHRTFRHRGACVRALCVYPPACRPSLSPSFLLGRPSDPYGPLAHTGEASKSFPVIHMRCMMTASFLAIATAAFLCPFWFRRRSPQVRKRHPLFEVHSSTVPAL